MYILYLCDFFQILYFCLNFFPLISICVIWACQYMNVYFSSIPIARFCHIRSLQCFLILFMNSTIRKHLSYLLPSSFFHLKRCRHFFHQSSYSLCIFIFYYYWCCSLVVPFFFPAPSMFSSYIIERCFLSVNVIQFFICYLYSFYMFLHASNLVLTLTVTLTDLLWILLFLYTKHFRNEQSSSNNYLVSYRYD